MKMKTRLSKRELKEKLKVSNNELYRLKSTLEEQERAILNMKGDYLKEITNLRN